MNIWDHLGELRKRLLVCLYALLLGLPIGAYGVTPFLNWLARPVGNLVFVQPMEAFTAQIKVAVGISFLIALPVILHQAWKFVSAALTPKETYYIRWLVPGVYLSFMAGVAFSTFWVFPRAVEFLLTMKTQHLVPMLSVEGYLDFFILLGLAFGFLFEMPLVVQLLAKLGILRRDFLEGHRKMAYFVILLIATLINPVPEVLTQLVLAGAAIALFELSMFLLRLEIRKSSKMTVNTPSS